MAEGVSFCSAHTDQATESAGADSSTDECCESLFEGDPIDALLAVAVGAVVIGAALVFRRVFRIL